MLNRTFSALAGAAVTAACAIALLAPATATAQGDVDAVGTAWEPDQVDIALGEGVTWHFDNPDNTLPHDVWLVPPGGDPDPTGDDIFQVSPGIVQAGGPPVSHTFQQQGSWQFICRLHSGFSGEWSGMVGTVDVGPQTGDTIAPVTTASLDPADPGPGGTYEVPVEVTLTATDNEGGSGVDSTEYAIDGGSFQAYDAPFTISAPGAHTVQYRSTDVAGNVEETKSVSFTIAGPVDCATAASDEFDGTALDPKWDVLRPGPAGSLEVGGGVLDLEIATGDMSPTVNTAQNVLLQDAPGGVWTATTKIDVSQLTEVNDQAGLVVWRSEAPNNLAKVVYNRRSATQYWIERSNGVNGSGAGQGNGNTGNITGSPTDVYIRVLSDGAAPNPTLRAQYSLDGETWTNVQGPFQPGGTGQLRVGVMAFQSVAFTGSPRDAAFDWFHLEQCGVPSVALTASPTTGDAPLDVEFTGAAMDPEDGDELELEWDFGDGQTQTGGTSATHTYEEPGTYTATLSATDSDGNTSTATATVAAFPPTCDTGASDEFDGSALDPKWDVLRPNPAGLAVAGGALSLQALSGDMIGNTTTAQNVLLQDTPDGFWMASTKVNISQLTAQGQQAGLIVWASEAPNTFAKIVFNERTGPGGWFERVYTENGGVVGGFPNTGVLPNATGDVWIRARTEGGLNPTIVAEYSLDGANWLPIGSPFVVNGVSGADLRVGLTAFRGAGPDDAASFDWFHLQGTDCGPAPPCTSPASDEFDGTALDPKWELRRPSPTDPPVVAGGELGLRILAGDMIANDPLAQNVLLQDAPNGVWTATTKVDISDLSESGEQAGLIVWASEAPNTFAKIVFNKRTAAGQLPAWFERVYTQNGSVVGGFPNTGAVAGATGDVYIRARSSGEPNPTITPEYSLDGERWLPVGAPFQLMGSDLRVGLIAFDNATSDNVARFDWFHLEPCGVPEVSLAADPTSGQAPLEVDFTGAATDPEDGTALDLEWDFGDGETATGGLARTHTYDEPGTYTATLSATDANGNTSIASVTITVTPSEPCVGPGPPEAGFERLWDGTSEPTESGWTQSGPGSFQVVNEGEDGCRLLSQGGLGLLWYSEQQFSDYVLRLQWRREDETDNSGVFIRFPDGGANTHNTAINQGYEVQIREGVQGDGENQKTGSIYNFDREDARNANPPGEWNDYEIRVTGFPARIQVTLNGVLVNDFQTTATNRGLAPGFIGLQNHGAADAISFRDIRIMELEPEPDEDPPVTSHALSPANPNGHDGWYRSPVQVTLTADDGEGGSGVDATEYSIDGGAFQAYAGPFPISADGEHTVEYRSTDVAGNVEATKSVEVSVDPTDPTTTAELDPATPGPGGTYEGPVQVTLEGDDGAQGSGIDRIQYRRGTSGPFQGYRAPLTISAPGEHTIQFRSIDVAGNFETPDEVSFTITEPKPVPSVDLAAKPREVRLSAFIRRGVEIEASCEAVDDGTLTMSVTRRIANRLDLSRLVLASAQLSCEQGGASATLEPSRNVGRALDDSRRSVPTTLRLRMSGTGGSATDTRPLTLERKR